MISRKLLLGAGILLAMPGTAQVFSSAFTLIPPGNSGIGTSTPTNFLDINGDLRIRNINQNDQLRLILAADANGVVHWRDVATIGGTDNDWFVAGSGDMWNLNSGDVAVGHTNPDHLFHVQNGTAISGSRIGIGSIEWIEDGSNSLRIGATGSLISFHPNTDCQTDLGTPARRFDRLYLCDGVYQAAAATGTVISSSTSLTHIRSLKVYNDAGRVQLDPVQVQAFMPNAVDDPARRVEYDEKGNPSPVSGPTSVNMVALTPYLIGAIQGVDDMLAQCCASNSKTKEDVDNLNERMDRLENQINELKELMLSQLPEDQRETLMNKARIDQNTPNPFGSSTRIRYFIPTDAQSASVVINNAEGVQVEVIELSERGEGSKALNTSGWTNSGVYYYSLIVDGELIATRKMVMVQQ